MSSLGDVMIALRPRNNWSVDGNTLIWQDDSLGAKFDIVDIPDDLLSEAKSKRESMIETAVEADDVIMEKYLNGTIHLHSILHK